MQIPITMNVSFPGTDAKTPTFSILIAGVLLLLVATFAACKKPEDVPGVRPPQLDTSRYCNDPEAINYNWDFPGTPDNSVCFYASDVFVGDYNYIDSAYDVNDVFLSSDTFLFTISPLSRKTFTTTGLFCDNQTLRFTADKFATAVLDTVVGTGQALICNTMDTVSGSLSGSVYDSLPNLMIYATFTRAGSVVYHRGTAVKQ